MEPVPALTGVQISEKSQVVQAFGLEDEDEDQEKDQDLRDKNSSRRPRSGWARGRTTRIALLWF
jgi:hypothetical protein